MASKMEIVGRDMQWLMPLWAGAGGVCLGVAPYLMSKSKDTSGAAIIKGLVVSFFLVASFVMWCTCSGTAISLTKKEVGKDGKETDSYVSEIDVVLTHEYQFLAWTTVAAGVLILGHVFANLKTSWEQAGDNLGRAFFVGIIAYVCLATGTLVYMGIRHHDKPAKAASSG